MWSGKGILMDLELPLEVSLEQDLLLQELVETYTQTVGYLLQQRDLPKRQELTTNLKKAHFKTRAIADAWIIRNRAETPIKLPSFRMNGISYRITKKNVLCFRAFVFQGTVDFLFKIKLQVPGGQITEDQQGVLTLFKDHRGWIVKIVPKKIVNRERQKLRRDLFQSIIL